MQHQPIDGIGWKNDNLPRHQPSRCLRNHSVKVVLTEGVYAGHIALTTRSTPARSRVEVISTYPFARSTAETSSAWLNPTSSASIAPLVMRSRASSAIRRGKRVGVLARGT